MLLSPKGSGFKQHQARNPASPNPTFVIRPGPRRLRRLRRFRRLRRCQPGRGRTPAAPVLVWGDSGSNSHPDLTGSCQLLGRDLELSIFCEEVAGLLATDQTALASGKRGKRFQRVLTSTLTAANMADNKSGELFLIVYGLQGEPVDGCTLRGQEVRERVQT